MTGRRPREGAGTAGGSRSERAVPVRHPRAAARKLAVAAAVALALTILLMARPSDDGFSRYRLCLTMLDVGQGDSMVLDLPGGARWLVDGGGGEGSVPDVGRRVVLPALRRAGIERLDAVVATHGHADHTEGLVPVLREIDVGELWIPQTQDMPGPMKELVDLAGRRGIAVKVAADGDRPAVAPPAEVLLLHPWPGYGGGAEENDRSIVLWVALGRVSFLLTGDVEAQAEERLALANRVPRSTLIKVPHHGSRGSSTEGFLGSVDPLVALAGAAQDNGFGFPHSATRRRYIARKTKLYWTGEQGYMRACTDGFALRVERSSGEGRWGPLAEWGVAEIGAWWEARGPGLPEPPRCAPARHDSWRKEERPARSHRTRAKRPAKAKARTDETGTTADQRRTDAPARSRAAAKAPEPEPTPPRMLDDKEWERHRRARRRL